MRPSWGHAAGSRGLPRYICQQLGPQDDLQGLSAGNGVGDLDPPVLLTLQDDCRACRRAMARAALSSDIRKLFYPVVPALITQDRLQGLSAGNGGA